MTIHAISCTFLLDSYLWKRKFPPKLLVWLAVSKKGRTTAHFRTQKDYAVNGKVYRDECMRKKLIPWIRKNYPDDYLFWPDLATAHYSLTVLELFQKKNINFLSKKRNPPNCPQLRPIENFWDHFMKRIFSDGFYAKSVQELSKKHISND